MTNTIYCPFSGIDGGANAFCAPGTEHCCEVAAGGGASMCTATGTACPAQAVDWQCADPAADCNSGQICCAAGATLVLGATGCANFASHLTATTCTAAGGCTGGITMCTSTAECPAGQTCTPFVKGGNPVGGCM
jgi:hypothetical protein